MTRSKKPATCCAIGWSRSTGIRRRAATDGCSSARRTRRAGEHSGVVFVPGLAERRRPAASPRRSAARSTSGATQIDADLVNQKMRGHRRAPAAQDRHRRRVANASILSYPRLDVGETRARVPSFYALDVMRAITGSVPDHRALAAEAAEEAGASLGVAGARGCRSARSTISNTTWRRSKPLLDSHDPAAVKGHAHYLLGLNEALRRSVISRWARGRTAWSDSDGLVRVTPGVAPGAREQPSRAAAVFACRRCSGSPPARISSCSRRFIA